MENEDLIVEKLDTSDNHAYDELLRTSDNEKSKKKKKDLSRFSKKEDFINLVNFWKWGWIRVNLINF